jgi:arsenate reductase
MAIDSAAKPWRQRTRSIWPERNREGENAMNTSVAPELQSQLDGLTLQLATEFAGLFSRETIARYAVESADLLARGATVQLFIPIFVERLARERLRALAQAEGRIAREVPEVLFICVHNAGRSQMAATLLHHHARGRAHARSAGSAPAGQLHSAVVAVMSERGLDLSEAFPKPLTDEVVQAADVIVTMGCGDACPLLPDKRYLDWNVPDPIGQPVDRVRAIRDDIERRVLNLLREVGVRA